MKSLNDRYSESHGNTHETFADLVFCALVVLVLFVMMLAIEVSQRVRADLAKIEEVKPVEVVKVDEVEFLSAEEVAELSERLQKQQTEMKQQRENMLRQQQEIVELRRQITEQESTVKKQMAAMQGEQRFTGLTQPASIGIAYDYGAEKYYFIPSKDVDHADTRVSGESTVEYIKRKTEELVQIAFRARKQRGYTTREMIQIFSAFSQYQEIEPTDSGYDVQTSKLGISYHVMLCGFIAGDTEVSDATEKLIIERILQIYDNGGPESDSMYPRCQIIVDPSTQTVKLNDIELSPRDLRDVLLAFSGRGAMLDFEGYDGPVPQWLNEEVLTPTGYIGKTPKLPGN
ncbi:hypothetical protein Pla52o_13730 [Novipirellula galeiformis]|uniref:Uncharacterized protein n=1 Tax=Novipirellula galeiformis TaxID=2528004 RepID=A0A5C6CPT5_9BACT|nr:hypothetical protein [Novipirellula galeiformis]TWU25076.1 hypothetical protein Pla52o_13730 [Novipirellula galeiformis]